MFGCVTVSHNNGVRARYTQRAKVPGVMVLLSARAHFCRNRHEPQRIADHDPGSRALRCSSHEGANRSTGVQRESDTRDKLATYSFYLDRSYDTEAMEAMHPSQCFDLAHPNKGYGST